jgi:hypothetical protein
MMEPWDVATIILGELNLTATWLAERKDPECRAYAEELRKFVIAHRELLVKWPVGKRPAVTGVR